MVNIAQFRITLDDNLKEDCLGQVGLGHVYGGLSCLWSWMWEDSSSVAQELIMVVPLPDFGMKCIRVSWEICVIVLVPFHLLLSVDGIWWAASNFCQFTARIRDCRLELQAKIEPLSPKLLASSQLERKTKHSIALLSNNVPCSWNPNLAFHLKAHY